MAKQKECKHEWREFASKWHAWDDFVSFYCTKCLKIKHLKNDIVAPDEEEEE